MRRCPRSRVFYYRRTEATLENLQALRPGRTRPCKYGPLEAMLFSWRLSLRTRKLRFGRQVRRSTNLNARFDRSSEKPSSRRASAGRETEILTRTARCSNVGNSGDCPHGRADRAGIERQDGIGLYVILLKRFNRRKFTEGQPRGRNPGARAPSTLCRKLFARGARSVTMDVVYDITVPVTSLFPRGSRIQGRG